MKLIPIIFLLALTITMPALSYAEQPDKEEKEIQGLENRVSVLETEDLKIWEGIELFDEWAVTQISTINSHLSNIDDQIITLTNDYDLLLTQIDFISTQQIENTESIEKLQNTTPTNTNVQSNSPIINRSVFAHFSLEDGYVICNGEKIPFRDANKIPSDYYYLPLSAHSDMKGLPQNHISYLSMNYEFQPFSTLQLNSTKTPTLGQAGNWFMNFAPVDVMFNKNNTVSIEGMLITNPSHDSCDSFPSITGFTATLECNSTDKVRIESYDDQVQIHFKEATTFCSILK